MESSHDGKERCALHDALSQLRTPLGLVRLLRPDVLLELVSVKEPLLQVGRRQVLARYLPPVGWNALVSDVHVQHLFHDVHLVGMTVLCGAIDTREHRVDITARVAFRDGRVAAICDYAQPALPPPVPATRRPCSSSL